MKFEIGHVLFIDIVGYSKLLINEQSEQIQKLREIVRGTEEVRKAEAEGKLLRLPTGDGGALVFRTSPEAPVLCAIEVSKTLKVHPELKVRMGIHSGPVNEVIDLNDQSNIAGAGINIAQRVMDCGDAGHILLSKHVADDLKHYSHWQPHLHSLGECKVKHGTRMVWSISSLMGLAIPDYPKNSHIVFFSYLNLALRPDAEAVRLARQATELVPVEKDALAGHFCLAAYAEITSTRWSAGRSRQDVAAAALHPCWSSRVHPAPEDRSGLGPNSKRSGIARTPRWQGTDRT